MLENTWQQTYQTFDTSATAVISATGANALRFGTIDAGSTVTLDTDTTITAGNEAIRIGVLEGIFDNNADITVTGDTALFVANVEAGATLDLSGSYLATNDTVVISHIRGTVNSDADIRATNDTALDILQIYTGGVVNLDSGTITASDDTVIVTSMLGGSEFNSSADISSANGTAVYFGTVYGTINLDAGLISGLDNTVVVDEMLNEFNSSANIRSGTSYALVFNEVLGDINITGGSVTATDSYGIYIADPVMEGNLTISGLADISAGSTLGDQYAIFINDIEGNFDSTDAGDIDAFRNTIVIDEIRGDFYVGRAT